MRATQVVLSLFTMLSRLFIHPVVVDAFVSSASSFKTSVTRCILRKVSTKPKRIYKKTTQKAKSEGSIDDFKKPFHRDYIPKKKRALLNIQKMQESISITSTLKDEPSSSTYSVTEPLVRSSNIPKKFLGAPLLTHTVSSSSTRLQAARGGDIPSPDKQLTTSSKKATVPADTGGNSKISYRLGSPTQTDGVAPGVPVAHTKTPENTKTRTIVKSQTISASITEKKLSIGNDIVGTPVSDRPFSLPPGQFKPKQSLGQNFLSDQNYVLKIVDALIDNSEEGGRVVELGPGPGALSRMLIQRYPKMTAVEIDQRAVAFLKEKLPTLHVLHMDVLDCDWPKMANERGGKLSVIGNLPFYITSQILFSLADSWKAVDKAVVTMQYEVAERIVAQPKTKQYGILSVVFQLYGNPKLNFKIPSSVFFPRPKVDAALVTINFQSQHPELKNVDGDKLRKVITASFRQRRKMLRASLKELLVLHNLELPEKWSTLRPEALKPVDFVRLTQDLFGQVNSDSSAGSDNSFRSEPIWRKALELYGPDVIEGTDNVEKEEDVTDTRRSIAD